MNALSALYDSDFYAWAEQNAQLMKSGRFDELDTEHLIKEVESMGASEKRALESCLIELIQHLLKWQFQKQRRGASWQISIHKQRVSIESILDDNPSLKYQFDARVAKCYVHAKRYAAIETKLPLSTFPENCPYTLEQLADFEFMPSDNN
ncbi:MAG: DUF29 domain-containing protein [Methylococcaceae bacterium]